MDLRGHCYSAPSFRQLSKERLNHLISTYETLQCSTVSANIYYYFYVMYSSTKYLFSLPNIFHGSAHSAQPNSLNTDSICELTMSSSD